jgi:hypothetical protein
MRASQSQIDARLNRGLLELKLFLAFVQPKAQNPYLIPYTFAVVETI